MWLSTLGYVVTKSSLATLSSLRAVVWRRAASARPREEAMHPGSRLSIRTHSFVGSKEDIQVRLLSGTVLNQAGSQRERESTQYLQYVSNAG